MCARSTDAASTTVVLMVVVLAAPAKAADALEKVDVPVTATQE